MPFSLDPRATINVSPVSISSADVSSPTAIMTAATSNPASAREAQGECSLLGPFALVVQAALGALALLALVYKRWRERPQRPLKIWFFDVSKQVFGSVLVHVANIFMSMLTSDRFSIKLEPGTRSRLFSREDEPYVPNRCSFYLLNLAIDTTVGIPSLILLLRVMTGLAAFTPFSQPPESIQSGNYGRPPNAWWWLKQSIIYFCGLFGMKVCVLVLFLILPWISKVGDWALGWTEGNERLQIAFVMMIFPLLMNALQYYIIDSFIKLKETEHKPLASEDPDASPRYASHNRLMDREADSDADKPDDAGEGTGSSVRRHDRLSVEGEYDPDVDGDAPMVIGSSSSQRLERSKVVPKELYPKE